MKEREALKLALDWYDSGAEDRSEFEAMIKSILAQPDQEPVAWLKTWNSAGHARTGMQRVDLTPECETWLANMFPTITPLYTTSPQRTWVGLTDEDIKKHYQNQEWLDGVRFAEAKLKEKNTK